MLSDQPDKLSAQTNTMMRVAAATNMYKHDLIDDMKAFANGMMKNKESTTKGHYIMANHFATQKVIIIILPVYVLSFFSVSFKCRPCHIINLSPT